MELTEIQTQIGTVRANLKSVTFSRNLCLMSTIVSTLGLAKPVNAPGYELAIGIGTVLLSTGAILGAVGTAISSENIGKMKYELSDLEQQLDSKIR